MKFKNCCVNAICLKEKFVLLLMLLGYGQRFSSRCNFLGGKRWPMQATQVLLPLVRLNASSLEANPLLQSLPFTSDKLCSMK